MREQLASILRDEPALAARLVGLRDWSRQVRTSEYHLTNACNIRCQGCWFFEYDFERRTREVTSLAAWKEFATRERERGITSALLIGGEPTLHLGRVDAFVSVMPYVTISTNGLIKLPREGFENVNVALTLFGGGKLDDELRGHRPSGRPLSGLFDRALENYRGDDRAIFIYAVVDEALDCIEDTVRRIRDNGNQLNFNYYSSYGSDDPLDRRHGHERVLDEALRMREEYPETVVCTDYYIRTLITGRTDWGEFGYDTCPSISADHPDHAERVRNGNPVLPRFNTWMADLESVEFCCTSGHCEGCRDSQAVHSWLLVSLGHFLESKQRLSTWLELAESYWRQFVWSPYHKRAKGGVSDRAA